MKTKSKVLISALLVIALCVSVIAGTTFALFSSEDKVNIAVTSGKVNVKATPSLSEDSVMYQGSAKLDEKTGIYTVSNVVPEDKVVINVAVLNSSTITTKYRTTVSLKDVVGKWNISINGVQYAGSDVSSKWETLAVGTNPKDIVVAVELDKDETNQDSTCNILCKVEAVQGNAEVKNYPAGITEQSFVDAGKDIIADDGNFYANANEAIKAGVSALYCKAGADVILANNSSYRTDTLDNKNITIYANGADFDNGELSIQDATGNVSITVYDAKNITVWGAVKRTAVVNINLENCHNEEKQGKQGKHLIMARTSDAEADAQVNILLKDCSVSNSGDAVHSVHAGTIQIIDCKFTNVLAPINLNIKSNSSANVLVQNCSFVNCGTNKEDSSYYEYSAPIRVVSTVNSQHSVKLENNVIEGTVGVNGDILLGDYRDGKVSVAFDVTLISKQAVNVMAGESGIQEYAAGTHALVAHAQ